VAAAAGVAVVTVSRVVNLPDQVQAATRQRVLQAMQQLGYSPNLAARSMRTQVTRSIGFLTPELSSQSNAVVAQACEQALAEAGYAMLVTSSGHQPDREVAALALLRARGVDGIVLYVSDETHAGLAKALGSLDVPLVVLDRDLRVRADRVMSEHANAMTLAVHHLAALGHRRIVLIRHGQPVRPSVERERSFRQGIEALRLGPAHVLRVPRDGAVALDARMFTADDGPTAFITEGTRLLNQVLQGLRACGLKVPEDRSVIGLDTLDASSLTTPETTTVARDFRAVGRAAAELMVRRLAQPGLPPQQVMLDSQLLLKGSCAAPPRGGNERVTRAAAGARRAPRRPAP
jgi:LacI family transcriptional regulator